MISALGVTAVYVGSGSAGPFTLVNGAGSPILFENNSELVVQKFTNPDDSHPTTLVLTTDYTLTGAGLDTAGSLTLTSVLPAGQTLIITRQTPVTQTLDLFYGADLSLENLEETIDKIVRLIQERREQNERSILFSAVQVAQVSAQTRVFPPPVASKFIAWNTAGDRLENADRPSYILSGTGVPSGALGQNGDFYIDTSGPVITLYGPKTAGAWGSGTSLTGPQGPQGIQGIQGPPGAPGAGTGDVVSTGAVADNDVTLFDGVSGDIIKSSGVQFSAMYRSGGTDVALADGGTGASLVDPNADRIMFWDDSAGSTAYLTASTGLNITGTTLTFNHLGIQSLVDPNADRILFWDDSAGVTTFLAPTNGLEIVTTNLGLTANQRLASIPFLIDGGGATITTGIKGDIVVPFACTITGWTILGDQSGSIVVDVWKDTYANYPPTVADTIAGTEKPTISATTKGQDLTLTTWTTAVAAGDTLRFNVDSVTTLQRASLNLLVTKT